MYSHFSSDLLVWKRPVIPFSYLNKHTKYIYKENSKLNVCKYISIWQIVSMIEIL